MSGERDVQIDIDCCKYSACYRPNLMIHRVQGMASNIAMKIIYMYLVVTCVTP